MGIRPYDRPRPFSPLSLLNAFALSLCIAFGVRAQDGSSELVMSQTVKSASVLGSRLRVRCTDENLRLYSNATTCADERDPESCKMIFTTPASNNPAGRDPKCDNPLLKDLADQCRRTCAICCEDPVYACQNDESGIVNCNMNVEKCGMLEFSSMMIKFCPATCGLCLTKRCRDQIEDCEDMKSLCTNELYATFMNHQCARTCGKCEPEDGDFEEEEKSKEKGEGGTDEPQIAEPEEGDRVESAEDLPRRIVSPPRGRPKNETCVDLMKNCRRNKRFCHHPVYKEMMRKNCARTCGYCKPSGGPRGGTASRGSAEAKEEKSHATGKSRNKKECKDSHPFCKGWAKNGYCESDEYSEEEKREKCAKTCGLC
ncbi:hypothetical protein niasHT_026092 [Heterodera trifolii]|uniref:ShKT domain-containing protein n=1 Tax=Heterodera trifolii TaxID=157864 RepID=A0ABD2KQZ7_9BILA